MKPIFEYIVKPRGQRYNNEVEVGDKSLILNTEVYNHQYVNRVAVVLSSPLKNPLNIQPGDHVVVHHNLFRRWHNVKAVEKNSRGFLSENQYIVSPDQLFMYKKDGAWIAAPGYTFVKPIKNKNKYSSATEQPLVGVVKYSDGSFLPTQLVGFSPGDEYEVVVDGERLYRVMNRFINLEYEYKGDEEEYNPSWAQGCGGAN